jgi:hypothetical protein
MSVVSRRIIELDLLRGFFIVVIILDHSQFWPSYLQYLTGQGKLWVSAAEGFFLISGLLIGYLRAYKGARTPLRVLTRKLLSRAAMLYIWCVGITFAVMALTILMPGDGAKLPRLADGTQLVDLGTYVWNVISTNFASDWIYFLRLYAIMLAVTPLFIWLVRRGLWYIAALSSLGIYLLSVYGGVNEGAMQWQVLFFGAALLGWKLETTLAWLRARPLARRGLLTLLITATLSTMATSYFFVHGWSYVESLATSLSREAYISIRTNVDPYFSNNPMMLSRVVLSFLWFGGLLSLFHVGKRYISRYLGWLLLPFGEQSLSAYCLQALTLVPIVALVPVSTSRLTNTFLGLGVVLLLWALLKIPLVQKLLPR